MREAYLRTDTMGYTGCWRGDTEKEKCMQKENWMERPDTKSKRFGVCERERVEMCVRVSLSMWVYNCMSLLK